MKNILFLFLFLLFSTTTYAYQCQALSDRYGVSESQKYVMFKIFNAGYNENLGYSLAAIAFYESSAGVNLVNRNDPSGGVFHVHVKHVLDTFDLPMTEENIDLAIDMLSNNFDFAASLAMRELQWWLSRHNGSHFHAWRSYNGGYFWWSSRPDSVRYRSWDYATNIQNMVRFMESNCSHWEQLTTNY